MKGRWWERKPRGGGHSGAFPLADLDQFRIDQTELGQADIRGRETRSRESVKLCQRALRAERLLK